MRLEMLEDEDERKEKKKMKNEIKKKNWTKV